VTVAERALVHRGPATLPGCPEAVAARLDGLGYDVHSVGPDGDLDLTAEVLDSAALYAQPGGGTLRRGWRHLKGSRRTLRQWVSGGGRYLGFCLGGYLAGATPGLGLLPGDTDRWIDAPGATVRSDDDAVVTVRWRGQERRMFFQDGPEFVLDDDPGPVEVLARYPDGRVAALVAPFGAGRVGVVGPHPEATRDWFTDAGLPVPDGPAGEIAGDLADDLVRAVLA
jgi:hypothetical protein